MTLDELRNLDLKDISALPLAVKIAGVAITCLLILGAGYWFVTTGTFLVGLGWSFVNVASTALIADATQPHERGRAIGASDAFSSISGIVLPLGIGPLVEAWGLTSIAVLGVAMMIPPFLLLLRLRARTAPGQTGSATRGETPKPRSNVPS